MKTYLIKQKNLTSRMKSRSGGTFAAVSDLVLAAGGVVYGAGLDADFQAVHRRATTAAGRDAFRGSKYVQSDMANCYRQLVEDLRDGKPVLFSGTPCQVAGALAVCEANFGKEETIDWRDRLICMDIVCHGVPSPKVWSDYLQYMQKKHHGMVTAVDFRNKKNHGWWAHIETIDINGRPKDSQVFEKLFYEHNILRDCCHECPYKNLERVGDITIADAWGIAQHNPEFDDNYGVSLVLVSTPRGEKWLAEAMPACDAVSVSIEDYMQEPLQRPFEKPTDYEQFWERYFSMSFKEFVSTKYLDSSKQVLKWKVKRAVKAVVPQTLINRIRGR